MKTVLAILIAAFLAGAVMVNFYRENRREKKIQLRVKKLYASQLFEDMIPMLQIARHCCVEQLAVDKTGVVVRFVQPGRQETAFLMRPNGYNYLTPEQQEAMRAMLEDCLPKLSSPGNYHLSRKRVWLLNGTVEHVYQYTITNSYKAQICRASHYDGQLQPYSR